jgi:hypothetical protein
MSFLPDARLPRFARYIPLSDDPQLTIPICQKCRLIITSFVWNGSLRQWDPSHNCGLTVNLAGYLN